MRSKIEVSARHIHLTKADFEKLFKKNELTPRNSLTQKGEFAAHETVEVVGPDARILNVRIIGPFRESSQLEISKTDSIKLGIDSPLAISGSGKGAPVKIIGPKDFFISRIAMVPIRHLHLSEKSASKHKLKNGSHVCVSIPGERGTIFKNVVVRIAPNFIDCVHIDTDEANAAWLNKSDSVTIIGEKE